MQRTLRTGLVLSLFASFLSLLSFQSIQPLHAVSANPTPNCSAGTTCTITFTYSGDYYSWTAPSGATSVTFDVQGAQGGTTTEQYSPAAGGNGGRVTGTLAVTPGNTYYIYVGGQPSAGASTAGFNGGALGALSAGGVRAGSGGGASDIRTSIAVPSSRLVVAGGGGGAGTDYVNGGCVPCGQGGTGGSGGGTTGATGQDAPAAPAGGYSGSYGLLGRGGSGGTQSAGGSGNGTTPGVSGSVGDGGAGVAGAGTVAAGGGGGGYYGGGGGGVNSSSSMDGYGGGGGGGGSSYANATYATNVTHTQGYKSGSGVLILTYLNSPTPTTFSTSQSSPSNFGTSTTVSYSLVLSQSVTDLTTSDFQFGGTSSCNTPGLSGSGSTYTVTVTNCSEGSLILQLKANSITGTSAGPPSVSSANTIIVDRTLPTISTVLAPANTTYKPSETPTFSMVFSESVTVTGAPRLTLTVGSSTKYASFISMSDSKTALFRYTVGSDPLEFDTNGIAVATSLDLNSGSIADLATNALTNLSFTAPTLTSVLVSQPAAAPTIDSVTATSGQLAIYFTPGAARGSTTTTYQYSSNGGSWTDRPTGTTASPLTLTGLTNGTGYTIRLRATTNAGAGDSSTAVTETPTSISITGDSTLTLTYGNSASTSAYSASGGTNTFSWSLGSSLTGISLSGTTVTAGATTPAGSYTQSVRATDGNSQVGTKTLTITVNKASTSITIALPNSSSSAALGGAVVITATVPRAGAVNFMLGGTTISGCGSAAAASTSATCSWTPNALGSVSLTATFTPTDTSNFETSTTTTLSITVVNGVSTVTLSLTGGTLTPPKGQTINIIAAVDQAGRVTFLIDGKRIPGCTNRNTSAGSATCSWKPAVQKQSTITARLVPTNNVYNASTSTLRVQIVRRSGARS